MKAFYFKARDKAGHKRSGTLEALDLRAAYDRLQRDGLRAYFLDEYHAVRKAVLLKRRRQRRIALAGAVAAVLALIASSALVWYAGRERPPTIEDYARSGLVKGASGAIVAETREEREFGSDIYQVWDSFCPGCVTGLEVSKGLVTVYVNRKIRALSDNELEVLATNTARAHHRKLNTHSCTLLVVEEDVTLMEVGYSALLRSTRVKSYR